MLIITCDYKLERKKEETDWKYLCKFFDFSESQYIQNCKFHTFVLFAKFYILFRAFCIFSLIVYILSIPLYSSRSRWTIQLNSRSFVFHWLTTLSKIDFHSMKLFRAIFRAALFGWQFLHFRLEKISFFIAPKNNVNFFREWNLRSNLLVSQFFQFLLWYQIDTMANNYWRDK